SPTCPRMQRGRTAQCPPSSPFFARAPPSEARQPARDVRPVFLVLRPEAAAEARLLDEREVDRVRGDKDRELDRDPPRLKEDGLAGENRGDAGDHRIAHVTVRPVDDPAEWSGPTERACR